MRASELYVTCQAIFFYYLLIASCNFKILEGYHHSSASSKIREERLYLNFGWKGWSVNKPWINFTASVPFTVHSRLMDKGWLQDPYFRYNDREYRWVAFENWAVEVEFETSPALLGHSTINLVFQSIDTVADVFLNAAKVGSSNNKFVNNIFCISDKVKKGKNKVLVVFMSPVKYAASRSNLYKKMYNYSVLPDCYPEVLHGECHSNFIRKEPLSFGWDFGPSLPTQGLFKSVYVQGISSIAIEEFTVNTKKIYNMWMVHICCLIKNYQTKVAVFIESKVMELGKLGLGEKISKILPHGHTKVCMDIKGIDVENVKQWWPWQLGEQPLYTLQAKIFNYNQPMEIHRKEAKFGFRTVELVQEPISGSTGLSFFFKINGMPIFLKGSNWIPADALRDKVTTDIIDSYLQSAIDANMNVLRVWGGGGYESDYFYQRCDQLGILIWQDMMFACAMYPTDQEFLQSVKHEVDQQVTRLQHHPSIIIWSANNENEVALRENWYDTEENFQLYKQDYITLYVKLIKPLIEDLDPTRPFIVSSPSNGLESEREGWIAKDPRSQLFGDVHYYNYTANCWDPNVFPSPRFASEYGYQSYPSYEALRSVSLEDDLVWGSDLMSFRQHHQDGNQQIETMIKQNFMLPKTTNKRDFFKQMIFLSQIVQAVCVSKETEHYRRLMGRLVGARVENDVNEENASQSSRERILKEMNNEVDEGAGFRANVFPYKGSRQEGGVRMGHTMGAMYWQLNDIWQAPSWASLEYGGKWKMLHYYAKDFFRQIIITYHSNGSSIDLFVVSDLSKTVPATMTVKSYQWTSLHVQKEKSFYIDIPYQSSTHFSTFNVDDYCIRENQCFLLLTINVSSLPQYSYSRPVFVTPFNKIDRLPDPHITIERLDMKKLTANVVSFVIKIENPAVFVWLSSDINGSFSDNGFVQFEASRTVNFTARKPVDVDDFSRTLNVLSLYDVTIA